MRWRSPASSATSRASSAATARFVAINCGANVNFDRLRHVAERADIGGQREALLAVEIPEQKGSFLRFCELLGRRNVTEFNYRYDDGAAAHFSSAWRSPRAARRRKPLLSSLREAGYPVVDMSDNEMAKLHVRYMVGGHGRGIEHERLFRFEFPERPGALLKFLHAIGTHWNITLFHYRNHGSDYGRVLAGVQVPPQRERRLRSARARAEIRVRGRNRQSGVPDVPGVGLSSTQARWS